MKPQEKILETIRDLFKDISIVREDHAGCYQMYQEEYSEEYEKLWEDIYETLYAIEKMIKDM